VNQISRILCAVDFSEPAQAAFEYALALSRARDAELTVVHAVRKDQPFGWHALKRMAMITRGFLRRTPQGTCIRA
jgi:nucleotide-binding universal stress UspA family protein